MYSIQVHNSSTKVKKCTGFRTRTHCLGCSSSDSNRNPGLSMLMIRQCAPAADTASCGCLKMSKRRNSLSLSIVLSQPMRAVDLIGGSDRLFVQCVWCACAVRGAVRGAPQGPEHYRGRTQDPGARTLGSITIPLGKGVKATATHATPTICRPEQVQCEMYNVESRGSDLNAHVDCGPRCMCVIQLEAGGMRHGRITTERFRLQVRHL